MITKEKRSQLLRLTISAIFASTATVAWADVCDSPVTTTLPLVVNGGSESCYVTTGTIDQINSRETGRVEINGVAFTNRYWSTRAEPLPPKVDGKYVIRYVGRTPWSHLEIHGGGSSNSDGGNGNGGNTNNGGTNNGNADNANGNNGGTNNGNTDSGAANAVAVKLAAVGGNSKVDLSWTVTENITAVQVYRDTDANPAGRQRLAILSGKARSYTDTSVVNGTRYWYWIKYTLANRVIGNSAAASTTPGGNDSTIPVTGVTVTPSASIKVGATASLTATVHPDNASNKAVTWSSSNPSAATVSSTGVVTGIAKGNATITVTSADGNRTATSAITVADDEAVNYAIEIAISGGGKTSLRTGSHSYKSGSTVTITATPDAGYEFAGWSGAFMGNTNPLTITMDGNKTLTAMFTKTGDITPPPTRAANPYLGADRYVDPEWSAAARDSANRATADLKAAIAQVAQQPTSVWLDRLAAIDGYGTSMGLAAHLDAALEQQAARGSGKPMLIEIVVYDLPDRDCHALASNGELKIAQNGMTRYKTEYIDRIVEVLNSKPEYQNLRIVTIIEPDSLPNAVTNMGTPACAAAAPAYKEGVAYAIRKLATVNNVYIYLDMAHSGWLGWEWGDKAAQLYKEVMAAAGGENLVRGFATNVANYSALKEPFNPYDNQNQYQSLIQNWYEWNRMIDEETFVNGMRGRFPNHRFLIDTGRNGWKAQAAGVPIEARTRRGNWCNIKNAGIGQRPSVEPMAGVDAFVWIKPPGASDGTSDKNQTTPDAEGKRFDPMCGADPVVREKGTAVPTDAMSGAPAAGKWFDEHFFMLVRNATPALDGGNPPAPDPVLAAPTASAQSSVDAYLAGLTYDANRILGVQSIANGSSGRTQVGDPVETETADGSDLIVCSRTKHSLQQNFDQVAILRPTAGIVWPGALVKANGALLDGTPEPITLARGPMTLRVDLPGIGDRGTVLVPNPTGSSTQAAIDGALGWWNNNAYQEGYVNAASSSYLTSSAYSSEQAALDLGLHVNWASADVGTQFSTTSSTDKSVAMMLFKQTFYTVTVDPPSSPAATLAASVEESAVKTQVSAEAPPAYVHSVAYGRIILFRMETTDAVSSADMKASLQYSAGIVPVEASLEAKYKSILAKSTVTAITIGGNAEAAVQVVTARNAGDLAPIITGKNAVYSKNNPGVPIAYTVRFLKDNAIAKMGYTTDYTANECRRASPAWITVRNSGGWYSARASVKYVDHATKQPVQINARNITIGTQRDFLVPAGATGVECWADEMWGFGWTRVFYQKWGALTDDVRFCMHGTTLSPGWNNCQ